jgi:hypothetical protein
MYINSVHFVPLKEICKTYLYYAEDWVDETPEYIYIELTAKEEECLGVHSYSGCAYP